jgi:Ca2+-transporting ATPase
VLEIAVLQGVSMLVGVLGVYLWTVVAGRPDAVVRSATFATLVIGNLALILVNRSWRLSILQSLRRRRNPTLKWNLATASVLLVVLLNVSALRDTFAFGPMRLSEWAVALVAGLAGVAWFEAYKQLTR